jgi:hypothetical protein
LFYERKEKIMFQRSRLNRSVLIIIWAWVVSFNINAQELPRPQSGADLDAEIAKIADPVSRRLGGLESGTRVSVGNFGFEGYDTALGSFWVQNLISVFSNLPGRNFTLVNPPAPADYMITGDIVGVGNSVRIFTRLINTAEAAVIASWHTDLEQTEFLAELLDTGSSSGGRSNVPRDSYETDSMENPVAVEPGAWINRTIHNSNDQDWFLIVPGGSGMLTLETSGDMDTFMELFDDSGSSLEADDDGGDNSNARIDYFVEAGKRYIAQVRGYSSDTGRYRFRAVLSEINDEGMEPNETREQAFAITLGEPVTAFFHSPEDVDWYKVDIPAGGGQLQAYTEGHTDTLITVYDGGGNELAEDDDSGENYNARVSVPVSEGSVYIKVESYEEERGLYTLQTHLREMAGLDEFENDNTRPQAKPIEIGTPQRRTFSDEDDVDWVSLTVSREGNYTIRARGEKTADLDTYIELFDEREELIDEDDDGGEGYDSRLTVRLEPGTYYIKVHTLGGPVEEHYILSVDAE